jgi:hypothetical protein
MAEAMRRRALLHSALAGGAALIFNRWATRGASGAGTAAQGPGPAHETAKLMRYAGEFGGSGKGPAGRGGSFHGGF